WEAGNCRIAPRRPNDGPLSGGSDGTSSGTWLLCKTRRQKGTDTAEDLRNTFRCTYDSFFRLFLQGFLVELLRPGNVFFGLRDPGVVDRQEEPEDVRLLDPIGIQSDRVDQHVTESHPVVERQLVVVLAFVGKPVLQVLPDGSAWEP